MARLRLYKSGRWAASLPLNDAVATVGRSEDCALVLSSSSASRRHFSVEPNPKGEGYLLKDLESENGTFVDGVREYARVLKSRAIIQVGDEVILFELVDVDEAKKASDDMPIWAQKAIKENPRLLQLASSETEHVAPAIQRRVQAERLSRLKPHLVIVERGGRICPLDPQLTTVGYGQTRISLGPGKKGATTVLAEIVMGRDGHYWVHAKGLFAKVKVDGQARAKSALRSGAELVIGEHTLRFELGLERDG